MPAATRESVPMQVRPGRQGPEARSAAWLVSRARSADLLNAGSQGAARVSVAGWFGGCGLRGLCALVEQGTPKRENNNRTPDSQTDQHRQEVLRNMQEPQADADKDGDPEPQGSLGQGQAGDRGWCWCRDWSWLFKRGLRLWLRVTGWW